MLESPGTIATARASLEIDPERLRNLAGLCAAALNYRALGFDAQFDSRGKIKKLQSAGPQRKFAALLVCESFGLGQEWGQLDGLAFHKILAHGDNGSVWRISFIHQLMAEFVHNGWMVTDGTGKFRLLPDQWPNWPQVKELMQLRDRSRLEFVADEDMNTMLANISQTNAGQCEFFACNPPQTCETFAPRPKPQPPDPPDPPDNPGRTAVFRTEPIADTEPKKRQSSVSSSRVIPVNRSSSVNRNKKNSGITDENRLRKISRQCSESELMADLKTLLGEPEMQSAGGHWLVDHVRPHPAILQKLLIQLRELINLSWQFKTNRAAWLEASIKKELQRAAFSKHD